MSTHIKKLGIQPYQPVWEEMKSFTSSRQEDNSDELWVLEHFPVYTQGQAGKAEHILNPGAIPIIQSDRGGQVTYHGPGQFIAYVLMDLQRRHLGVKTLVCHLEQIIIELLQNYQISAHRKTHAPGVYVEQKKIASIGLRVKHHCTYHGIALNVDMDLLPFQGINPCGYEQLKMTQITEYDAHITVAQIQEDFIRLFLAKFEPPLART
jgi:lipoyl(octanoyl) transferase